MDINRNILLAKKYLVESIYRSANLEGALVNYPETQVICDGNVVNDVSEDNLNLILGIKDAWNWVFNNIDCEIDCDCLINFNIKICRISNLYAETFPDLIADKDILNSKINQLTKDKSLENALSIFCYLMKARLFDEGNIATAIVFANMYMIQNGLGILSIPVERKLEFFNLLTEYRENDSNGEDLDEFVKKYCLTGSGC